MNNAEQSIKEFEILIPKNQDLSVNQIYAQVGDMLLSLGRYCEAKSVMDNPDLSRTAILSQDLGIKIILKPE